MENTGYKKALKAAFPRTLPVMAGYLVLGFGFGLLLQSKGYNFLWALLMCVIIFAGSMQYVAVDLLASSASLLTAAVMTVMIQARHIFYGLSMLVKYRGTGKVKPYLIFGLTDETYSLLCSSTVPEGVNKRAYYFFTTFLNQIYWITGGTLGALFGQVVTINTKGVEFSMTALFVVILTENLLKRESRVPALIGLAISFICLLVFGSDDFLIPAMIGIAAVLMLMRPKLEERRGEE